MKPMKKFILWLFIISIFWSQVSGVFAQSPEFELIPEATDEAWKWEVRELWEVWSNKNFSQKYNTAADELLNKWDNTNLRSACNGLGNAFASGILNRDFIVCLAAQIVRFVSNMAMVVWALMVIYAWYIYAMSVFNSNAFGVGKWHTAIKYAIMGIVIVILSYAILNFFIEAFL